MRDGPLQEEEKRRDPPKIDNCNVWMLIEDHHRFRLKTTALIFALPIFFSPKVIQCEDMCNEERRGVQYTNSFPHRKENTLLYLILHISLHI